MRKITLPPITSIMSKVRKNKIAVYITASLLVVITALVYEVILPNKFASDYQANMQVSTRQLNAAFCAIAETQSLPVYNNANLTPDENLSDLAKVDPVIAKNKAALEVYKTSATKLRALPFSGYTASYKAAKKTRHTAQQILAEAGKRLNDYHASIVFFTAQNKANKVAHDTIVDFTKLPFDTSIATQIADIKINAEVTRKYAQDSEAIKIIKPMKSLSDIYAKTNKLNYALADALDARAITMQGTDVAADQAAAQKVNDIARQQSDLSSKAGKAMLTLRLTKDIRELPKLTER